MDFDKVRSLVSVYHGFPNGDVTFYDIHPIMLNSAARQFLVEQLFERYKDQKIDIVVGLESRGYYLGIPLADKLGLPFVPLRKANKLPGILQSIDYGKEYGKDVIEVQVASLPPGSRVVIIDDLLATGGTAGAAVTLVTKCGATVVEFHAQFELPALKGRSKLGNVPFYSFFQFE